MGQTKRKEECSGLSELDDRFLGLFEKLCGQAVARASECTDKVFSLTQEYLSKDVSEVLKKFYDLYFGRELDEKKEEMNREVDDLFDQIQSNLAEGRDPGQLSSSTQGEEERLGLSGLQKKIEGLIQLDDGIRSRVIPALSSMQFEDAVRQRLENICHVWKKLLSAPIEPQSLAQFAEELADSFTSMGETEDYYRLVLGLEPPEKGADSGQTILF